MHRILSFKSPFCRSYQLLMAFLSSILVVVILSASIILLSYSLITIDGLKRSFEYQFGPLLDITGQRPMIHRPPEFLDYKYFEYKKGEEFSVTMIRREYILEYIIKHFDLIIKSSSIGGRPYLFVKGRLFVLYHGSDDQLLQALQKMLGDEVNLQNFKRHR